MEKKIRYSVIIPVYNREGTVSRCLESLLSQNRRDVQILVVDDGSTDGSADVIQAVAARYPSVEYLRKENGGVSSARNLGLEKAAGEYILFVDSDDYVSEDYFAALDCRTENRDWDLLVFQSAGVGGAYEDEADWFRHLEQTADTAERLEFMLMTRMITHPINKCYVNGIIQKEGLRFTEGLHIGEDFEFCIRYVVACEKIETDSALLYYYDLSDQESLSRRYRPNLHRQMHYVYTKVAKILGTSGFAPEQKHRLLAATDYLFVKQIFSGIAEEFKGGRFGYFANRAVFDNICISCSQPLSHGRCGIVHRGLRWMLALKMYWLFYCVTYFVKGIRYKRLVQA